MSLSNLVVRAGYLGNGATVTFPIPFAFQNTNQVLVLKRAKAGLVPVVTVLNPGALQDYTLTGANPPTQPLPTDVTMNVAPLSTDEIWVYRVTNRDQIQGFDSNSNFSLLSLELTLDRIVMQIQELGEMLSRAPLLAQTTPTGALTFPDPKTLKEGFVGYGTDGKLRLFTSDEIISNSTGVLLLNAPTDGNFGNLSTNVQGAISGVNQGDYIHDAFDKVEVILEKLAPPKPPFLSAVTMLITGSYSAKESGTGTLRTVVIDSTSPVIATPAGNGFNDGDIGTLSAEIDDVQVGTRALTTASDIGTYGQLQITADYDYYAGQSGKENFWKALRAQINASGLTLGAHKAELIHSNSGTSLLNFSVDDPGTPSISSASITGSGTGRRISGVPSLATGDTITASFTVLNAIKSHYNATRVASISGAEISAVDGSLGSVPNNGDSISGSIASLILANKYNENLGVTCIGYNSKGTTGSLLVTGNIRVDTVSNESARLKSGTGQYPAIGTFGGAWVATDLLSANKELQMVNGLFQYPILQNYSSNLPVAGPDYSSLTPDSYANMRWVTFNMGAKSSVTSVTLTINGGQNLGSSTLITGMAIYVLVDGATPTTGWVDANAAYPGVGNPTANGDAALDVGSSSVSTKRVTFGSSPKTGNVWVRIGIPSGSTKKFSGLSIS